jgi:hypothetical protein
MRYHPSAELRIRGRYTQRRVSNTAPPRPTTLIAVDVFLNGEGDRPYLLIVDSGATVTFLRRNVASDLQLPLLSAQPISVVGQTVRPMVEVYRLDLLELRAENWGPVYPPRGMPFEVVAADLDPLLDCDGLLGMDFLSQFPVMALEQGETPYLLLRL